MSRRLARGAGAAILALVLALPAGAQESRPHFVYLRLGSETSTYLYYIYDFARPVVGSRSFVFSAAIIHDPHAEEAYWEWLFGPGLDWQASAAGVALLGLVSRATDAWYLEPSAYAWAVAGRVEALGFGGAYLPLEDAGIRQYFLDPASLLIHVADKVAAGASYSLYSGEGLPTEQGMGPGVRIGDPARLTATVEYFRGIENFPPDWRLTLQAFF